MELVLAESRKAGLSRISKVIIELGALSTYKAEPLQFYFDILKSGFPSLKEALLEIEEVSARLHCRQCGADSQIEDPWLMACPVCHSTQVQVSSGKDLLLKQLVGDKGDAHGKCSIKD